MESIGRIDRASEGDAVRRVGARRRPRGEDEHEFADDLWKHAGKALPPDETEEPQRAPSRAGPGETGTRLDVTA